MAVVVRAAADPSRLANHVRAAVRKLDPSLAVANIRLMDEIAERSFATHRFTLFLVGLFAAFALALAAGGIYGVISYSVNQRMHEVGMRMALGARGWDVMRLVLGHGVKIAAAGVILGLASATAMARVIRTLLYEVSGTDPVTFAGVAGWPSRSPRRVLCARAPHHQRRSHDRTARGVTLIPSIGADRHSYHSHPSWKVIARSRRGSDEKRKGRRRTPGAGRGVPASEMCFTQTHQLEKFACYCDASAMQIPTYTPSVPRFLPHSARLT
jgi:hypothetical protein